MRTDYSKPSSDIAIEWAEWLTGNDRMLEQQSARQLSLTPLGCRESCLLCTKALRNAGKVLYRSVRFLRCSYCGHIQAEQLVDDSAGEGFDDIYPRLDLADWRSRRDRIYKPKLDWILSSLAEIGLSAEGALAESWLEVGAGAGYFLGALLEAGAKNVCGLDANRFLAQRANQLFEEQLVVHTEDVEGGIGGSNARIIASFFVLEHLADPLPMFRALAVKPVGTIFAFAVPTFGFGALLETAFPDHAARALNSVVHRQLYTDRSIDFLLNQIGYSPIARWVFGQDALDLQRLIATRLREKCDEILMPEFMKVLTDLADPLQHAIDKSSFADSRHVLAVKT
jgi:SAM-dependent methyltransferase